MKALAEHRFGSPLKMGTPRENGGPYRGEVFNTGHYLIQEVATRSVVFHRKDQMTFVSERLKWMDENVRLNGAELQVGYDGSEAKVYPWDRARDLLDRAVRSLKKSAQELNFSPNLEGMLDQLQARSWARIRELRTEALEKSKEPAREPGLSRETGTEPDR
jgi:putative DNA primase/helicase